MIPPRIFVVGILIIDFITTGQCQSKKRSFELDLPNNQFLKDGEPFRFISGTIHYFRVHPSDWRDRIQKLKYAGCNTLETYVEWSSHEPEPGIYDFTGWMDLVKFINIAAEEGLLVILRPGPFIDAERDMGGLPYWLLRENPAMKLRSNDQSYIHYVDQFYNVLYPLIKPLLYANGGPIIMIQLENEYGSYPACDFYYTSHLRDQARSLLGEEIVLFTTDGYLTRELKCGKISDVYATVDFKPGTNVSMAFGAQRLFEPQGPLINSEFYPGWLDFWGEPHATRTSNSVTSTLDEMLAMNASVNIFVFHGGTNFGMTTASNIEERFKPCPTSYDYDAPLSEAGDPTEKYFAIRETLQKYVTLSPGPAPGPTPKQAYGDVQLSVKGGVLELIDVLDNVINKSPLTFEALSVSNGIVVYSTKIPYMIPDPSILFLDQLHDRGYVFVGDSLAEIVSREHSNYKVPIFGKQNDDITVVVESQGRVAYGGEINDFKGITRNVKLENDVLYDWKMTPLPLLNTSQLQDAFHRLKQRKGKSQVTITGGMTFYEGTFDIPEDSSQPKNTFLRLDGWSKGYAWINDFLLGRYWPVEGPQVTLFIPWGLLRQGSNSLLVLELEKSPCEESECKVTLVDTPEIDGPTPHW